MAKTIFYSLAALVRKIFFCHSKIKFISSHHRVIFSLYTSYYQYLKFSVWPKTTLMRCPLIIFYRREYLNRKSYSWLMWSESYNFCSNLFCAYRWFATIPVRFKRQRPWRPCWMTGTIELVIILLLMVIQHGGDDVSCKRSIENFKSPQISVRDNNMSRHVSENSKQKLTSMKTKKWSCCFRYCYFFF